MSVITHLFVVLKKKRRKQDSDGFVNEGEGEEDCHGHGNTKQILHKYRSLEGLTNKDLLNVDLPISLRSTRGIVDFFLC